MTIKEVATLSQIAEASICRWENNIIKGISIEKLSTLSKSLNCSVSYLLEDEPTDFSVEEMNLIRKYRELDLRGKDIVNAVLEKESGYSSNIYSFSSEGTLKVAEEKNIYKK